jgi:uncharacterized protein YkwD
MLIDHCLLTVSQSRSEEDFNFEMHSLVQLSIRHWLATSEQLESFQQQFFERMAVALAPSKYKTLKPSRTLIAHAEAQLRHMPRQTSLQHLSTLLQKELGSSFGKRNASWPSDGEEGLDCSSA